MKRRMTDLDTILDYLDKVRKSKGISQEGLGLRTNSPRQYWSALIAGTQKNPGFRTIQRYARALGYDIALVKKEEDNDIH